MINNPDRKNTTSNNVRHLRTSAGMTQQQLADAAHVTVQQIRKLEGGQIKITNVTLATASRLADALDVDIKILMEDIATK